jgi:hypothetical protein
MENLNTPKAILIGPAINPGVICRMPSSSPPTFHSQCLAFVIVGDGSRGSALWRVWPSAWCLAIDDCHRLFCSFEINDANFFGCSTPRVDRGMPSLAAALNGPDTRAPRRLSVFALFKSNSRTEHDYRARLDPIDIAWD